MERIDEHFKQAFREEIERLGAQVGTDKAAKYLVTPGVRDLFMMSVEIKASKRRLKALAAAPAPIPFPEDLELQLRLSLALIEDRKAAAGLKSRKHEAPQSAIAGLANNTGKPREDDGIAL